MPLDEPESEPRNKLASMTTILGGGVGAGAVLGAIGFAVEETYHEMLGLPVKALTATDYLSATGRFLLGLSVTVLVPVLFNLALIMVVVLAIVALVPVSWKDKLRDLTTKFAGWFSNDSARARRGLSSIHLVLTLILFFGLFAFGAIRHFPLYLQHRIAVRPSESATQEPLSQIVFLGPIGFQWIAARVQHETDRVRQLVVDKSKIANAMRRYRNDILILSALVAIHIMRIRSVNALHSLGGGLYLNKAISMLLLATLTLNSFYLIVGYSTFIRSKELPRVSLFLKRDHKLTEADAEDVQNRNWTLIDSTEKEISVFRDRVFYVLGRDDLAGVKYLGTRWIFDP